MTWSTAWPAEHASWNGGAMDAFVSTHTSAEYEGALGIDTMGYYKKSDLPFYYDLAEKFTVCDNYFCSVLGPTHPNRLMAMTGSIDPGRCGRRPDHSSPTRVQTDRSRARARGRPCPRCSRTTTSRGRCTTPTARNYQPGTPGTSSARTCCCTSSSSKGPDLAALPERLQLLRAQRRRRSDRLPAGPDDFAGRGQQHPAPGVVDPAPRLLRRAPTCSPALGEWYTQQVLDTLLSNPDSVGKHRPVHHVRRERRLLRPRPASDSCCRDARAST